MRQCDTVLFIHICEGSPAKMPLIPVVPENHSHVLAEFDCLDPLLSALRLDSGRLKVPTQLHVDPLKKSESVIGQSQPDISIRYRSDISPPKKANIGFNLKSLILMLQ